MGPGALFAAGLVGSTVYNFATNPLRKQNNKVQPDSGVNQANVQRKSAEDRRNAMSAMLKA